jgi:hypothetical protein
MKEAQKNELTVVGSGAGVSDKTAEEEDEEFKNEFALKY